VISNAPITPSADLGREIPVSPAERHDRIDAALASLRAEHRRCLRLGLETPIARCEAHLRYWEFLGGLFALDPARSPR
jgi:hypothetical protein